MDEPPRPPSFAASPTHDAPENRHMTNDGPPPPPDRREPVHLFVLRHPRATRTPARLRIARRWLAVGALAPVEATGGSAATRPRHPRSRAGGRSRAGRQREAPEQHGEEELRSDAASVGRPQPRLGNPG
jgi:hypothetical protein